MSEVALPNEALSLIVNGDQWAGQVAARQTLADLLRDTLGLTGTNLGCEQGVCGACTVLVGGAPVRSCLMFAVQAEGCEVRTVEGLRGPDGGMHPIQRAFAEAHGLQCGFCTPGFLLTVEALLSERLAAPEAELTEDGLRKYLSGNICRCTGYTKLFEAVRALVGSGIEPVSSSRGADGSEGV